MSASAGFLTPGPIRLGAGLALALGATLLTAACSSSSSSSPSTSTAAPAGAGGSASSTAAAAGSGSGLVITTKSGSAGAFLTDGSGRAVYLWVKDGKDSSACEGACAGAWPPVTATGAVTASGAVTADLSTITRSGGAKQVAYDGHPLYYFAGDSGAGQVNGQGSDSFGAKWWLVDPAGTSITAAVTVSPGGASSAPASPAGGGAGGGY